VPWREARFAALDFETTGLDLRRDAVVSFGVVPIDRGRVAMRGAVHQLIEPHVPPSPRSQQIHELRPQDLAGSPRIDEARSTLADALEGRFVLAWFASVELHFLSAVFGGRVRPWRRRMIDVRTLAIVAEGAPHGQLDHPGFPLGGTAHRYGVPVANPHEALDDALVTAQLFLVLASRLRDGVPTVRELLRAGRP
jgi:DNA polymerase-3 subunit epsilon